MMADEESEALTRDGGDVTEALVAVGEGGGLVVVAEVEDVAHAVVPRLELQVRRHVRLLHLQMQGSLL